MFRPPSSGHNRLFLIWPCSNASAQSDKERNVPKSLRSNLLPSSSHQPESRTLHQTTATTQHKTHQRPQLYFLTFGTSLNLWPQNPIYVHHVHDAINAIIFVEPTTPMDVSVRIGVGVGVPAILIVITVAVAGSVLVSYGKKKGWE